MKTVNLSQYDIDLKDGELSWGEAEEIKVIMAGGYVSKEDNSPESPFKLMAKAMLESTYKLFEVLIVEIRDKEGKKVTIENIKDWAYKLSKDDGKILADAVNALSKKKESDEK